MFLLKVLLLIEQLYVSATVLRHHQVVTLPIRCLLCKTISCDKLVISRESVGMICIIFKLIVICYLHVFLYFLRPIYIHHSLVFSP
jgi:hypothetical protein